MDTKLLLLFVLLIGSNLYTCTGNHEEEIPYENVENICKTCDCQSNSIELYRQNLHELNCASKNFKHILARWPPEFGSNQNGIDIKAIFSNNKIGILQQLPATNATLKFVCRNCSITKFQVPTFMDVPNIKYLDLSRNDISTDQLTPDVFRGPYRINRYEPIALIELDLSFNKLHALNRKVFEHTPNLKYLSLSNNKLSVLDNPTALALSSAVNMEWLDLSATDIKSIPDKIFEGLYGLKKLNLAENKFSLVPANLELIGKSLEELTLAGNNFLELNETSFLGLKALRTLNIQHMPALKIVSNGTFSRLETLEVLQCSHNPLLADFDLDSLIHCSNLKSIDISNNRLSSLYFNVNLTVKNNTSSVLPHPWSQLKEFHITGNPWMCDCDLLRTLEFVGTVELQQDDSARCDGPFQLVGASLNNLTATQVCAMNLPRNIGVYENEPSRFLRRSYVIRTIFCVLAVLVLGTLIGFIVVCVRRRMKSDEFGVEPIRYTSVRSSNLSAFSQVHTNGGRVTSLTSNMDNNANIA